MPVNHLVIKMDLNDIVIGAVIDAGAKSASHIAAILLSKEGVPIRENPWFSEPLGPSAPAVDDWVICLGVPLAFLATGLGFKNDHLTGMGIGAALAGFPMFAKEGITRLGDVYLQPQAGLPRGRMGAPQFIPSVLVPKYQYGDGNPIALGTKARLAGGIYPQGYVPTRPGETAVVGARQPITVGPYAGGITAPRFTPGVLRPKYQHGA